MFEQFANRENTIFDAIQNFSNAQLHFIVLGGYAVSAYKHRFSVDADLVIRKEDKTKFEEILAKMKFVKTIVKSLDHIYAPEFIRHQTKDKLPVSIDLLINGVGSRTTNASFGIEELEKYSGKRKIIGTEKEITALVLDKEMLIVLKLHSGRLTDFRDVVALSANLDFNLIKRIIWRGKRNVIKDNIKKLILLVEKKEFIGSFKGVFVEKEYDVDVGEVKKFKQLLD